MRRLARSKAPKRGGRGLSTKRRMLLEPRGPYTLLPLLLFAALPSSSTKVTPLSVPPSAVTWTLHVTFGRRSTPTTSTRKSRTRSRLPSMARNLRRSSEERVLSWQSIQERLTHLCDKRRLRTVPAGGGVCFGHGDSCKQRPFTVSCVQAEKTLDQCSVIPTIAISSLPHPRILMESSACIGLLFSIVHMGSHRRIGINSNSITGHISFLFKPISARYCLRTRSSSAEASSWRRWLRRMGCI